MQFRDPLIHANGRFLKVRRCQRVAALERAFCQASKQLPFSHPPGERRVARTFFGHEERIDQVPEGERVSALAPKGQRIAIREEPQKSAAGDATDIRPAEEELGPRFRTTRHRIGEPVQGDLLRLIADLDRPVRGGPPKRTPEAR
jgi:hypothetical protein